MSLQLDQHFLFEGDQDHKLVIYQLLVRLFSNTKSENKPWGTIAENGCGKFNDINDQALKALKDFGLTHLWYTGVIEHATMTDYTAYGIAADDADIVKGRAGSPYAVKDYYDVDPDLAVEPSQRMQEFEALVQRTHAHDLKVLIDFVPNHVARNYSSKQKDTGAKMFGFDDDTKVHFHPQNNYYYFPGQAFQVPSGIQPLGPDLVGPYQDESYFEEPAKATGNDVFRPNPSVNDWYETVKLNYGVDYQNGGQQHFDPIPDTWLKMLAILRFWAEKGVDGFRCDMVHMVPVEFWHWCIPSLKVDFPELLFIGEIYDQNQYREYIQFGHFDYLYDKVQLYDTLKKIMTEDGSTHWLTGIWQHLRGINKHMLRFLENHDEQRIASRFFAGDPHLARPAMFVSATWHTGPVMIYSGQEFGEPALGEAGFSKDDGRTTIFDYWGVREHQKWVNDGAYDGGQLDESQRSLREFYQKLLHFSRQYSAITQGYFYDLNPHLEGKSGYTDKVLSYLRWYNGEHLLLLNNFSASQEVLFELSFPGALLLGLDLEPSFSLKGVFGTEETLHFADKVSMKLPPLSTIAYRF